jgi:hypothetical protein
MFLIEVARLELRISTALPRSRRGLNAEREPSSLPDG